MADLLENETRYALHCDTFSYDKKTLAQVGQGKVGFKHWKSLNIDLVYSNLWSCNFDQEFEKICPTWHIIPSSEMNNSNRARGRVFKELKKLSFLLCLE